MQFHFVICGYGLWLQIGAYDICMAEHIILSWALVKKHQLWRGETHTRSDYGYRYKCTKNGKVVESLSFRSPIVNLT